MHSKEVDTWQLPSAWHPKPKSVWISWLPAPGRTKAFYLREIIDRGLADMEDYYLAAEVLERVRKGQEQVYSSADVRKDLGLDG